MKQQTLEVMSLLPNTGEHQYFTHVLINDPTKGYGILIENMLGAVG